MGGNSIVSKTSSLQSIQAIICGALKVLALDQAERFDSGTYDGDKKAMESAASHLLPIMFKLVSETKEIASSTNDQPDANNKVVSPASQAQSRFAQSLTEAIAAMAKHASKDTLKNLFQKLVHQLLEEVQSEDVDCDRVCSLLSLAEALVASEVLEDANISFLY